MSSNDLAQVILTLLIGLLAYESWRPRGIAEGALMPLVRLALALVLGYVVAAILLSIPWGGFVEAHM